MSQSETAGQGASESNLLDIMLVLGENLRVLIVVPLVAGVVALGISFLIPPTFTAVAKVVPPFQLQSSSGISAQLVGAIAGIAGASAFGLKTPSDQYVALLKSRTVFDEVIARFNLKKLYDVEYTIDARKKLETKARISASAKDGVISIEVDDHNPKLAADIANGFVDALHNLTKSLAVTEAAQRRLFFAQQLKQAKDDLVKSEVALRESGANEGLLKVEPRSVLENLARLQAQITAQEIRVASMRSSMTDTNPEIRLANQELMALREQVAKIQQATKETGNDATGAKPAEGNNYIALYRDFKYHEVLFELLLKQFDFARLDEAREGTLVQVMDAAVPPERKSRPSKALIAVVTTITTFILVLIFVFVRHAWRNMATEQGAAEKIDALRRMVRIRRDHNN